MIGLSHCWRAVAAICALASVLGSTTLAAAEREPARPPAPRKPNIILILADDLGYGDLGCYGQTQIQTPNLDKLAAEGVRFTDFYAGSTVCAPSRCALMTGLHTGHTIIRGNAKVALRPEDRTVAEVLQAAGYHTGLVGKWGLGNEKTTGVPQKKGFDEFGGYLDQTHAHDYYTDHLWRADGTTGVDRLVPMLENQNGQKGLYTHDLFTTAALNFINSNKPDLANKYRPFFLFLAYTIPHANNEEGRRSGNGMQVPSDEPYSSQGWPQTEKNKAAMITRLDRDVGRILTALNELKLDDNTLLIFSSDNGPHKEGGADPKFFHSSGPLRGIKRDLYEGGIRVPMIARWPLKIRPGRVSNQVWAAWDLLPTLAAAGGADVPKGIDGISMLPAVVGGSQTNQHEFLYWEFHEGGFKQAVRLGDWKAVRLAPTEPPELYDLKTDLGEQRNVAGQHPEVIAKIREYLKIVRTESADWPVTGAAKKQESKN